MPSPILHIKHVKACGLPLVILGQEKNIVSLFPVTVRKKKGEIGKNIFLHYFLGQKCVFYACLTLIGSWEVAKNFMVGIYLNKNIRVGLQETNNFFLGLSL